LDEVLAGAPKKSSLSPKEFEEGVGRDNSKFGFTGEVSIIRPSTFLLAILLSGAGVSLAILAGKEKSDACAFE
jgi:hypothetical protein